MITLAVVNARVWTGNPRQPWASGIAVQDDKILAVASSAEVAKLVAASTRVIDAKGKVVSASVSADSNRRLERGAEASFFVVDRDVSGVDAETVGSPKILAEVKEGRVVRDLPEG